MKGLSYSSQSQVGRYRFLIAYFWFLFILEISDLLILVFTEK